MKTLNKSELGQIWDSVRYQRINKVWVQVEDRVRRQGRRSVRDQVRDQVWNLMYENSK